MMQPNPHPRWRLVVSDLDGTLLDENSLLSQENIDVAKKLARRGIGLTLATGRMDVMAQAFAQQLDIRLPIISSNGAMIKDRPGGKIIRCHLLPPDTVIDLLGWLHEHRIRHLAYSQSIAYYPQEIGHGSYYLDYNRLARQQGMPQLCLKPIEASIRQGRQPIMKVMAHVQPEKMQIAFQKFAATLPDCDVVRSTETGFDIMAKGVSKGEALRELTAHLGLKLQEVVAIGDQDNDASMLQAAGLGIAMQNASPLAQKASELQTGHHHQAGFAKAIEKYVLG